MKNDLFSTKIKKRMIFGFVFAAVFLGTVCPNRTAVYAQDRLKWVFELDQCSSPVVSESGIVYVPFQDHYYGTQALVAIKPDGTELWRHHFQDNEIFTPAIGSDGTLYFGGDRGFYAFDPDSVGVKWTFPAAAREASPAIDSNGTIYIGSADGYLYALNPEGTLKWKCKIGIGAEDPFKNIRSSPAIGQDGTIYVACRDAYIYAVTQWGTIKWKCETDHFFETGSPSIGSDGTIYAGPHGLRVYAINPDGTVKWYDSEISNFGDSSPVVAADGTIYIGSVDGSSGSMYAYNPDGSIRWKYFMGTYVNSTPLVGSGGIIYLPGPFSTLYAFNPDGTINWKYENVNASGNSPAMSSDGTLYVGTEEGLYAFQTDSNGYQEGSPWPTFMHNNTRSVAADEIELPDLYTVSGRISMQDSLMNVGMQMSVNGLTTETLEDSTFALSLPNGEYVLEIHSETLELPKQIDFVINGSDVVVQMEQDAFTVSGYVFEKGEPLVGLSVAVEDAEVLTDENGMYSFELGNGVYVLRLDIDENSFPNSREFTVDDADMLLDDFEINSFLWEYRIGERVLSFPAFAEDGSILVLPKEGDIFHLNGDGTYRESFSGFEGRVYTPSQGKDGTFYLPGWGTLTAWTPVGGIKWNLEIEENGFSSPPAIGQDGTLYIGSREYIYALNPENGSVLWTYPVESFVASSPSIAQDGTIYVPSNDNHLYAMNPDGTLKWEYESPASFQATPAIDYNGILYLGGYDMHFHALNPDGSVKWKFETMSATNNDAVIDADGTIYFTNQDDYLYALNSDGTLKWKFLTENRWSTGAVVITEQNTIFAASTEGQIYLLNKDGSLFWTHRFENCDHIFPTLADDGTMYLIMNEDSDRIGYIRAFRTGTEGNQKAAPWPCYMANNQRTGNNSDMTTAVTQESADERTEEMPSTFALGNNYPNPFNSSTTISYSLPEAGYANISVFSASGQKVATLLDEYKEAGTHSVLFDSKNLASGVYFYRMESPGYTGTLRMLLIK
ncbi:PQQ-binding-like beta-propeller repeat protein [Candidatus Latescibacterota bacterium]